MELMDVVGAADGDVPELIAKDDSPLEAMLEEACRLQLLDKCIASGKYKFAHEKIQQAAYMLVSSKGNVRSSIHLKIGTFLLQEKLKSPERQETLLFAAADQFARCEDWVSDDMKLDLARLDLDVAERAIETSGFVPAAAYPRSAIKNLSNDGWTTDYDLTLRLHTLFAQTDYCVGDFEGCKLAVDDILSHGKNLEDKMPAYLSLIDFLCADGGLSEALEIGSALLEKLLREPFPQKPTKRHVLLELIRTNRALRNKSDDDLLDVEVIEDEGLLSAMKLMTSLTSAAWLAVEPELLACLCLRMVRISFIEGLTKYAATGYVLYGFVLAHLGKHSEAYRYGCVAKKLLKTFDARETESYVLVGFHLMIRNLRKPYNESLEPLLYGHRIGMESGDIGSATLCLTGYMTTYLFFGLPLRPLQDDMRKFGDQMAQYGQETILNVYRLYWQCVLNFQGKSDDPSILTGEIMDKEVKMKLALKRIST